MKSHANDFDSVIATVYDLRDIVRRPVMLDMVCETTPYLAERGKRVLAADLYDLYVSKHLETDASTMRFHDSLEDKRVAIRRLAEHLVLNSSYAMHYADIAKMLQLSADVDLSEFLSTSFLIRDANGNFQFSHRSFLEFFGAESMFRRLQYAESTPLWLKPRVVTVEQWQFLDQMIESACRGGHRPARSQDCLTFDWTIPTWAAPPLPSRPFRTSLRLLATHLCLFPT